LTLTGGLICLAVAVFFAFMPGPAIPFWFLGAVLISSQLLIVARFLDKIELIVVTALKDKNKRRMIRWVLVPCIFVGSGIGTYLLLFKFLPKVVVIFCAVIAGALAAAVPYAVLKDRK
jgi:hypothetical protein